MFWKLSPLWLMNTQLTYQWFAWSVPFKCCNVSPKWRINPDFGPRKSQSLSAEIWSFWSLFFRTPMRSFSLDNLLSSIALEKCKKECNMCEIILVQGFCKLKINVAQFPMNSVLSFREIYISIISERSWWHALLHLAFSLLKSTFFLISR